jgi:hypothetical protein
MYSSRYDLLEITAVDFSVGSGPQFPLLLLGVVVTKGLADAFSRVADRLQHPVLLRLLYSLQFFTVLSPIDD